MSDADYEALAHAVKQPLDRDAVDALSGKDAENLCKARAFVSKLRGLAGDKTELTEQDAQSLLPQFQDDEVATGTKRFVDAQEWAFARPVIVALMARMLSGKIGGPPAD